MRSHWRAILLAGLFQGVVIYLITSIWLVLLVGDGGWEDWIDALTTPEMHLIVAPWAFGLLSLEAVILWPVRKPTPINEEGVSLALSLITAGLAIAAITIAGVFSLFELVDEWEPFTNLPGAGWVLLVIMLGAWVVATPLLLSFSRRTNRDTFFARLSSKLFLGTLVETVAIIPLDVMVRKRTDCYCGSGTAFALTLTGSVGLITMGPAIFVPLIARRRKRWWQSHCDACGYDMVGTMDAERCPECGAGWKTVST